jgi:hypothetical protein
MKNEIKEFFERNEEELEYMLNDVKRILENDNSNKNENSFTLLHLLSYIDEEHIKEIKIREDYKQLLISCLRDEKNRITSYIKEIKEIPKLVDFEWKFIDLSSISNENAVVPKILVKLIYSNAQYKIVEADFSTFKKLQEEIEESLSAYNSVYSKRIESFAK